MIESYVDVIRSTSPSGPGENVVLTRTSSQSLEWWRSERLAILAVLMACLKLLCAAFTIGTGDVHTFHRFADALQTMDLCSLYRKDILFNHTPLVAVYLKWLGSFAHLSMQRFAFLVRLPGILSDLGLILFFLSQRRQEPLASCPGWALALFIASPVSFLISGFHGNFDSVVVCFLAVAAWMGVCGRPLTSAVFLALSLQVKVPAIIVLPVFLVYWRRQHAFWRFSFCLVGLCVLGWARPLTQDPIAFLHNVLAYNSFWGIWGVTYWLAHTGYKPFFLTALGNPTLPEKIITQALKLIIIGSITLLAWTRRPFTKEKLFPVLAIAWSIFFSLTPGACVQYMVWLAPFVLLYHARWYLGLTICCSVFCYMFYHIICHAWLPYTEHSTWLDYWLFGPWMLVAWLGTVYGIHLLWRAEHHKFKKFLGCRTTRGALRPPSGTVSA